MKKKNKRRRRKKKRFVEIKTNKRGWQKVQLLKVLRIDRVLLRMPNGEIVSRGTMRLRWGVTKQVAGEKGISRSDGKKYRTNKKRRRYKRTGKKVNKKWQGNARKRKSGFRVLSNGRVLLREKRKPPVKA